MPIIIRSLVIFFSFSLLAPVFADGGGGYSSTSRSEYSHLDNDFDKAVEALENEDYSMAIKQLEHLQIKRPRDADLYNLLGYSHRKLKDFTFAEEYYLKALSIEPEHLGANEYIGELYLQTNRLAQAEKRLQVLKKASFFRNKQYKTLKKSIKAHKAKQG